MSSTVKPPPSAPRPRGVDLELSLMGGGGEITSPLVATRSPGISPTQPDEVPVVDLVQDPLETGPGLEDNALLLETGFHPGGGGVQREEVLQGGGQAPPLGGPTGDVPHDQVFQDFSGGFASFGAFDLGGGQALGSSFFSGVRSYSGFGLLTPGPNQMADTASLPAMPGDDLIRLCTAFLQQNLLERQRSQGEGSSAPVTAERAEMLGRLARLEMEVEGSRQSRQGAPSTSSNAPSQVVPGLEMLVLLTRLGYVSEAAFSDPDVVFMLGDRVVYLRELASRAARR